MHEISSIYLLIYLFISNERDTFLISYEKDIVIMIFLKE